MAEQIIDLKKAGVSGGSFSLTLTATSASSTQANSGLSLPAGISLKSLKVTNTSSSSATGSVAVQVNGVTHQVAIGSSRLVEDFSKAVVVYCTSMGGPVTKALLEMEF